MPHSYIFRLTLLVSVLGGLVLSHGAGHDEGGTESATTTGPPAKDIVASGNVGLAFGLSAIAAVASAVGSFLPLFDDIAPRLGYKGSFRIVSSHGFLAGSMGLSAGVLLFLSLGDLLPEALAAVRKSGIVGKESVAMVTNAVFIAAIAVILVAKFFFGRVKENYAKDKVTPSDLENSNLEAKPLTESKEQSLDPRSDPNFKTLGVSIAIAIACHNFPEGLGTFTTTLASPQLGALYAFALILHKIPEGLMIALPIYYATGSKVKAFAISASVGIVSQMLGATLGYLIFATYWNEAISGFIFAAVAGCLVYIIIAGLLPTGRRYDSSDKHVTVWFFVGVGLLALVNALFGYA